MDLNLTNVFTVSVSAAQQGIGNYNNSNVGLFTREAPGGGFGSLGYKLYLDPQGVVTDFGTGSVTAAMANAIFSQKPNILAGGGYLAVMPFVAGTDATQTITYSAAPVSGSYVLSYEGFATAPILWSAVAADIQAALRVLPGLSLVTVSGSSGGPFTVHFASVGGNPNLLVVSSDSLQSIVPASVTVTIAAVVTGTNETIGAAVTRTASLVQYFAIMAAEITPSTALLAGAAIIQPLNKIAAWVSRTAADVAPSGLLDELRTGSFDQNRGLFYGADVNGASDLKSLVMMASYVGRGFSVDFTGSNTTITMHLKDLIGVQPDATMNQTLLNQCQTAGADVYASFQGVPKTFTSGANNFFDRVYNRQWFVGQILVAGFNTLATVGTKLPQTEDGMSLLKAALRAICTQAAVNQYVAPGSWTSPTTFGILADFLRNVGEVGFYLYSQPISQQNTADRNARLAPLIQIAIKEAGAIHKGNVIIYINQ